jgi:hypothetical protein
VIEICSTTSFGREVKLSAPCCKILQHVNDSYSMKETLLGKIHVIYCPGSPASLLGVSAGYCQRPLIGELRMTRTQMGKRSRLVMITVYERPCAIALCISNVQNN